MKKSSVAGESFTDYRKLELRGELATHRLTASKPGVYVHFPFCRHKCGYCDFYSLTYNRDLAYHYSEALITELNLINSEEWTNIGTIFLGGGTPSLMDPSWVTRLLAEVSSRFSLDQDCEITMEMNPGTINLPRLKLFSASGVNRASVGVQSLNQRELELLGRIHRRDEVGQAVEWLCTVGLTNFSLDLIYGIPGQSMAGWEATINEALALKPSHISCYLLQLEPEVPLAVQVERGDITMSGEDLEADMYYRAVDLLTTAGFEHYELSNFARPGFRCRHNVNYWKAGSYLGLGAGAVSCSGGRRWQNLPDVADYIQRLTRSAKPAAELLERMNPDEIAVDAIILGLRMIEGIDTEDYRQRFGINPLEHFAVAILSGVEAGLLEYSPPFLKLTRRGYFLSNRVFREFMTS